MSEPTPQNNLNQPIAPPQEEPQQPALGLHWTEQQPAKPVTEAEITLRKLVELGNNQAQIAASLSRLAGVHNLPEIDPASNRIQDDSDAVLEFRIRLVAKQGVLASVTGSNDLPMLLLPSGLISAQQRFAQQLDETICKPLSMKFARKVQEMISETQESQLHL